MHIYYHGWESLHDIHLLRYLCISLEDTEEGIKVGGKIIKALRFADDQAMLAGSEYDLQRMLDQLNRISAEYNMKINTKKTKVMKIGKEKGEETTMMIVIEGERIEEVKEF